MRYDWRQLSPGEKEALLRHFVLHQPTHSPVTVEQIYETMQRTHFLSCSPAPAGGSVFQFLPAGGARNAGAAVADDTVEGIYKAALRTQGIDLYDAREQKAQTRATRV